MTVAAVASNEPDLVELRFLRELSQDVDALLEESLRTRENLSQTFRRCLPRLLELTKARAVAVTSLDEELTERTWFAGDFGDVLPAKILADHAWGVHRYGTGTLVTQGLDVAGNPIGRIGLLFDGDLTRPEWAARILRTLDTIAEELDTVLVLVHTASEKHQLILDANELLGNAVFELGMDQAVLAIARRLRVPGFLLLYRDAVDSDVVHYRSYRFGHLEHESGADGQRWPALEAAIAACGGELISRGDTRLRTVLGGSRTVEAVLISGAAHARPLGKIVVWTDDDGFSAFTLDVLQVLASTLAQRLVDYNRERVHLSQFFSTQVIDQLLEDPDYQGRYLSPRDAEVGILFADINGFTRICEQVLESPAKIGRFVDRWSDGVVDILFRHGGVFDKMVGDCVIGLFGPPFFRSSHTERAEAAVRAACEIQSFTRAISAELPEVERIRSVLGTDGLGVAIGVNLAQTCCGLFGPNQHYTGFSTGMNQAARLQSLGEFREILVMEPVRVALEGSTDPVLRRLRFGPLAETPVKNVSQPLRHHRLLLEE